MTSLATPAMLTLLIVATAAEPVVGDVDLVKYGVTQGGLLLVVLVLLWGFRREFRREVAVERARASATERREDLLLALVGQCNTAMQRTVNAAEEQEKATHRLARAIERLEDRRSHDDRRKP
jgi:hypothetical protein